MNLDPENLILDVEEKIRTIKTDPVYIRLLTSQRGIKDDQRFKAYNLQLNSLEKRLIELKSPKKIVYVSKLKMKPKYELKKDNGLKDHISDKSRIIGIPPKVEEKKEVYSTKLRTFANTSFDLKAKPTLRISDPLEPIRSNLVKPVFDNNIQKNDNIPEINDIDNETLEHLLDIE